MPSEWTVDTLHEHINARICAIEKAISISSQVTEQRAQKLETATTIRFESVNEFRNQTKDLQQGFMPRAEFDAAMRSVNEKIAAKNIQVVFSLGIGFVAVLAAIFNFASAYA